jgi:NAD(P)-dependent dehydrogenase (short-subunit alcohol dehydrogenase family)
VRLKEFTRRHEESEYQRARRKHACRTSGNRRRRVAIHILNIAPPLNMKPKWFKGHAYPMAKYGMSMCVLCMAEEFRSDGIAV